MKFINSLRGELMKIKGSALLWLSIIGTLLIPVAFIIRDIVLGIHLNALEIGQQAWMMQYARITEPFIAFVLPMGIILICSLIAQVEYKNNNWKQVHTTPQRYTTIFFAKYTVLFLLAGLVFLLLLLGVYLLGAIPALILDGSFPNQGFPIGSMLTEIVKCFIIVLPIIGTQYLVSMRFENFLVSIGVGLAFFVGTILIIQSKFSFLSPFSYAFNYVNKGMPDLSHKMYMQALVFFVVLTVLNYILYITKKHKG